MNKNTMLILGGLGVLGAVLYVVMSKSNSGPIYMQGPAGGGGGGGLSDAETATQWAGFATTVASGLASVTNSAFDIYRENSGYPETSDTIEGWEM